MQCRSLRHCRRAQSVNCDFFWLVFIFVSNYPEVVFHIWILFFTQIILYCWIFLDDALRNLGVKYVDFPLNIFGQVPFWEVLIFFWVVVNFTNRYYSVLLHISPIKSWSWSSVKSYAAWWNRSCFQRRSNTIFNQQSNKIFLVFNV